jgi:CRP/FNR family transcriptional regulator
MEPSTQLIKKISLIPLFEGLTDAQQTSLARIAVERKFKRGEIIFSEDDEGNGFYVLITGRVKIYKLSVDGKEQILQIMDGGETFGEAAIFAGENFPAYARALAESRVFFFPRAAFVQLIRKDSTFALNMLAILSKRLRNLAALVESLSLKEVPGRMAAYILYLSRDKNNNSTPALDISKNQLAGILGTIPETVSRILARMRKEKLITTNGRQIQAMDIRGLEELAGGTRRLA